MIYHSEYDMELIILACDHMVCCVFECCFCCLRGWLFWLVSPYNRECQYEE